MQFRQIDSYLLFYLLDSNPLKDRVSVSSLVSYMEHQRVLCS